MLRSISRASPPLLFQWQIFITISIFEAWDESQGKHYMRGGKPGAFPPLTGPDSFSEMVHPVPFNLYDPFGLNSKKSEEAKARGLKAEINNGRLAMIGIFGFLAESKVTGSVPALAGKIPHYDGDYMAPFASNFHTFLEAPLGGL